jgi:hypothetical protein
MVDIFKECIGLQTYKEKYLTIYVVGKGLKEN